MKKKALSWMLPVAVIALSGCAANVVKSGNNDIRVPPEAAKKIVLSVSGAPTVTGSADWAPFRGELRNAFANEAEAAGIAFTMGDGTVKPTGEAGTLLSVQVNDYRYLSTGARYGLGIMTGNAFVNANVRYLDLKTGRSFGEQTVNTSSTAWQGVFSAMTDKQLQAIAHDVVGEIRKPQR
ncbi:hypothetical protein [Azohydromonas caseinilytica]|uniref:Lipoprotein n=1 Tax=Azohydromonas caseinilytica TaxID=2728836 RepID=A0A848FJY0_9BURK|nr:hypothetical protein [Azohydromonas caseinilytica]NML18540.1 hypothetical protein [Azohydromonas caseinilytica]